MACMKFAQEQLFVRCIDGAEPPGSNLQQGSGDPVVNLVVAGMFAGGSEAAKDSAISMTKALICQ
ncbi:hypothetical protein PG997_012559 [Apiospora hydei]|uniref:Uncharacterized protein n=1 Tax=Apiospora hydei TaxID=1337664 RepID=A0ABR1V4H2_9PEZI